MATSLWQRLCCCFTGHDDEITSLGTRVCLRCRNCGRTSPGLELVEHPFHRRAERSAVTGVQSATGRSNPAVR